MCFSMLMMLIHGNTLNILLSNTLVILLTTANLQIVQELMQFSRAFVINFVGSVYTCIDSNNAELMQILHLCIR